jgi:diguanylate cyclase (GGDEF)-like protein/PAS domain S-box-containing protein
LPRGAPLVGVLYFVTAAVAIVVTRVQGGIALIWLSNALAAAILIRAHRVRWYSTAAILMTAAIAANMLVAHRPLSLAFAFSCLNCAEIALMVWAFRAVFRFDYPDISVNQAAVMTAVFGIAIPGLTALAGGLLLQGYSGMSFGQVALQWWSAHTIGACLLGPPIILASAKSLRRLATGRFLAENLLTLVIVLVSCWLVIRYAQFPFVAIGMLLMIAAFRVGGFGASLLSLCSGFMIAVLWAIGVRPLGLAGAPVDMTLLGLPVIALLATTLPPIAVGLGTDARRAAVRKLDASERRFREAMEHSPIGMLIASLDGVWGYTNIALQEMLGYTAQEFQKLPPGGPSDPQEWLTSSVRWNRLLMGEINSYGVERRFLHKQGNWIWTHTAVSLVRDEDGVPSLIAQIENLEARRRVEKKLEEEKERLRITLMSIDDAVITTDAQTRITYINASAVTMLGSDMQEVQGRLVAEVIHLMDPQTSKAAANLIGQSAIHGKVFRRESACVLHRSDGTVRFVADVVSPVLDSTGLLTGMVIVLRDASGDISRARDLTHRANHDALTSLFNRAAFEQRLADLFSRSRLLGRQGAVLAIDLDRFKAVNDAAGHAAGDAVLCKVAEICRGSVRSSDTVARLGGDEFAILLDNCSQERANAIGQQILRALNPLQIEWQGTQHSIGASIGLAMWDESLANEKQWIAAADDACYRAKRGGRGQLQVDPEKLAV